MKKLYSIVALVIPLGVYAQNEVKPEGYKLLWFILFLIAIPLVYYFLKKVLSRSKPGKSSGTIGSLPRRKLKVELLKDRKYRPSVLTLRVSNNSKKPIDLNPPILQFRKIWTNRKFKLKGINRYEIYPLYLEAGKIHELRIDLSVFYNHNRKLKRFNWAKIRVIDSKGKKYPSSNITLRKSLFS